MHSCYIVGLQALPSELLRHLAALSALTLSNCELDEVPGFVTGAPALECLSLAGVGRVSCPDLSGLSLSCSYILALSYLGPHFLAVTYLGHVINRF